jgi:uncharacterized membrane protein
MSKLILGLVIFFGVHSLSIVALGWRNRMAERLGLVPWQGVYSVAAIIGFLLIVSGYGDARPVAEVLYVPPNWLRYVSAVLMLPAFTLALAAYLPGRIQTLARNPLLVATKLWALAHLLSNGSAADVLLFGFFLFWAGAVRISLKFRPPRPIRMLPASRANDTIALVGGLGLYAVFVLWLHVRLFGVLPLPGSAY